MMLSFSTLTLILIALYFLGVLLAAKFFAGRLDSLSDYFLAGRSLGAVPVAITFVASWFGAASFMGSLDALHDKGLSALWLLIIPSLCCFVLITGFFARRVSDLHSLSQAEAVERHYGRWGRLLNAVVIIAATTTLIASQMVAAGRMFEDVLGVDLLWGTLITSAVVVTYASLGGYFSVVVTDILQFTLFSLALLILTGFVITQVNPELLSHFAAQQPPTFWQLTPNLGEHLALTFTFLLAWSIAPEMWQRMSSTRTRDIAHQSGILATLTLAGLFCLVVWIGLNSAHLLPTLKTTDASVLVTLAKQLPNPMLTALVLLGFLAAVTSTMDSSMNVGSLALTHDLYSQFIRPQASMRERLWVGRGATLLVMLAAMSIALYYRDIIQVLWISADIYAAALFFPVLGILFSKTPYKTAGLLAMTLGLGATIFSAGVQNHVWTLPMSWSLSWLGWSWPGWPYSTLVGVGLSGMGFGLGVLWDRFRSPSRMPPPDPERSAAATESAASS